MSEHTNRVHIDLVFDEKREPSIPHLMRGGLKIEIDGSRLFEFENEEVADWSQWAPEYLTGRISIDVVNILETARDVLDGTVGIYETTTARIEETRNYVVVEQLSKNRLRVAYHLRPSRTGERTACPVAESERGYAVDAEEFGRAALACGRQYRSRAEMLGFGTEEISSVVETMEDLETVLDQ